MIQIHRLYIQFSIISPEKSHWTCSNNTDNNPYDYFYLTRVAVSAWLGFNRTTGKHFTCVRQTGVIWKNFKSVHSTPSIQTLRIRKHNINKDETLVVGFRRLYAPKTWQNIDTKLLMYYFMLQNSLSVVSKQSIAQWQI